MVVNVSVVAATHWVCGTTKVSAHTGSDGARPG
jgi:hypothetical protein